MSDLADALRLTTATSAAAQGPSRMRRTGAWAAALAVSALYGALLFLYRPLSPFEWDEVLFLRALDRFDVADHSPHPPGYPAYVLASQLVRRAVGEPLLALQCVSILAAAATLPLLFVLARRLGSPRAPAAAAAVLLAAAPAFAFHANVGLSDVSASAAGVAAALALVGAGDSRARLSLAALLAALATGVRPQVLALLLPLVALAGVRRLRARGIRALGLPALAGLAGALAVWTPAVLSTGPREFLDVFLLASRSVASSESGVRLPGAPVRVVLGAWLVDPFGSPSIAAGAWLLVAVGTWHWVRTGRRTLAAVAGLAAGAYLLTAMYAMNHTTAARYALPALPFLALLAAGVLAAPRPGPRRLGAVAIGAWLSLALRFLAPVYELRLQPAPVWAALQWVRDNHDPLRTTVLSDPVLLPHVEYVLAPAGFRIVELDRRATTELERHPQDELLLVTPDASSRAPIVFHRAWRTDRLRPMAGGRYEGCAVWRIPRAAVEALLPPRADPGAMARRRARPPGGARMRRGALPGWPAHVAPA
jgi:hypothetical protein